MQIILLEKVVNLGNLGDIVKVKDGYARNFLIPALRGVSICGTPLGGFYASFFVLTSRNSTPAFLSA